ncbi:ABC transporter substrate-binding protein [Hoyosella rhizosphaerae]|uniref:Iron ABC transporter substrate-binding protein n=1 Tax=Hoyosella rhizosphaerae TaxID=1755582 RepID=A0A916U093_9ACTN|nr:ABC transporter substrate-binding protein [Hoyosella rhizosphaerae]MBN4926948.1 ABC transporter substrate-binding protein [Hoyosella rhizosphaerae]GGC55245.1 iron ABC transporter substrate-binding protein [Hoyosella rhizosphaerae]
MVTKLRVLAVLTGALLLTSACSQAIEPTSTSDETLQIVDDFDRSVDVPVDPSRIAVLEWEGLVAKTLAVLNEDDRIVAVDPATKSDPARQVIVPAIADATDVGSPWSGINYEVLASLAPDMMFLEAWVSSDEDRQLHEDAVEQIERLGIPVIVFMSPSNFDNPAMDTAYDVITKVGDVLDRSDATDSIVEGMKSSIDDVVNKIPDLPDDERPTVAIFASIAYLMGEKSIQSELFASMLGARNVAGGGTFVPISEEKLLALDPDVLVVAGHEGYIGLDEVYGGANTGIDWSKVQTLRAISSERVTALGYNEWRATLETPIALLKVASVLYPEAFADVDIAQKELDYYQDIFGLDDASARDAIDGQQFRGELDN